MNASTNNFRKTGIDVLGDIPWGTHFCQFYETKEDLLELLIPYFKAGLENNEFCLWIIFDPISIEDAFAILKESVPDFQEHLKKNSIKILPCKDWYFKDGEFDEQAIAGAINEIVKDALTRGYDGIRANGNETWLKSKDWDSFMKYENELNTLVKNLPIIVLCTYPLLQSDGRTLLDVAHAHECVVTKRKGRWEILEEPELKKKKADLLKANKELDTLVAEQTRELKQAIEKLEKEITERKKAEELIKRQIELSNEIIDAIPVMAWSILPDDTLEFINQRWINYTGLTFNEAIENPTSTIHPDDFQYAVERWMTNKNARISHDDEMRLRRADGKYCWFLVRTAPLRNEHGDIIKWYGVAIDIEDRKEAEEKLNESYHQIRLLSEHLQNIREEERTHIAREIHDELGQQLTVLKMDASWIKKKISNTDYTIKEKIEDLMQLLDTTVQSVRRISYELRPYLLDLGLCEAIEWHLNEFEKRSDIKTSFNQPKEKLELADSIKTGLFRIFQESLTNVAKHSEATHVQVDLIKNTVKVILSIADDGKGFSIQETVEKSTLGILGMKERAAMMGGSYEIESEPGKGTIATVTIPFTENEQL